MRIGNIFKSLRLFHSIMLEYGVERQKFFDIVNYQILQSEAKNAHFAAFSKYKGMYKGKNVAVIGSGPTLDKWECPNDCIQIGVNATFLAQNVNLDFLFIQDYVPNLFNLLAKKGADNNHCEKFFGCHYYPDCPPIPEFVLDEFKAKRYFFYNLPYYTFPFDFPLDISTSPFIIYGSTIHVAAQFALYTHPEKLYIVGCDCNSGHFSSHKEKISNSDVACLKEIITGWKKFSSFAKAFYPDVKIVCVNPVGLKGVFIDEYTE